MRLAIDIGGTWLRWESVGEEEFCGKIPSAQTDLVDFIEETLRKHPDLDAVAVSFAGQVHDGTVLSAPNLSVREPELRDYFEVKHGVQVILENDLNCAALAEALYWDSEFLCALYSGSGLGAGIVERGELLHGYRSLAGEIGHLPYRDAPFRCGCGKTNCLELYASGSGMKKWMTHYGCPGEPDLARWKDLEDERCRQITERFTDALLHAAADMLTLCNPEILILGGGVVAHNPWLLDAIRSGIGNYALAASLEGLRIEKSQLEDASLEGAKLLLDRI